MAEEIWIFEVNLRYAILFQPIQTVQRREVTPTVAARGWPEIYFCRAGICIPLSCHDYLHIPRQGRVTSELVAAPLVGLPWGEQAAC